MSLRVKMDAGKLVPLEPLPPWWVEGGEIEVESDHTADETCLSAANAEDRLTDDEARDLQEKLDEMRRLSKEYVRKVMGLPE